MRIAQNVRKGGGRKEGQEWGRGIFSSGCEATSLLAGLSPQLAGHEQGNVINTPSHIYYDFSKQFATSQLIMYEVE